MLVLERECWAVGYEEWQIRLYLSLETVASSIDHFKEQTLQQPSGPKKSTLKLKM